MNDYPKYSDSSFINYDAVTVHINEVKNVLIPAIEDTENDF